MTLIRTGLLNAVAVAVRLISMLVLNKILAILIGPSGFAIVGQLQNITTSITAIGSAGVGTGVTKFTAEYSHEPGLRHQVWKTAVFLGTFFSLILCFLTIVYRDKLSLGLLRSDIYSDVFIWMAVSLCFYVFNTFLLSVINGLKEIRIFVTVNIVNSLISLILICLLTWLYGLHGALVALVLNQSVVCCATIAILINKPWFNFRQFIGWPEKKATYKLMHFTIMAITTSVLGPLTQIMIRNALIDKAGIDFAGYWEGMTRISNAYLSLLSSTLTLYLIPKLSETKELGQHFYELKNTLRVAIPATILVSLLVYIFRSNIVAMLFSPDFLAMEILFGWQIVGDIVRSVCWVFSFYLISQSSSGKFVVAESLASIFFIVAAYISIDIVGFVGVAIAYTLTSIFYAGILMLLVLPMFKKTSGLN